MEKGSRYANETKTSLDEELEQKVNWAYAIEDNVIVINNKQLLAFSVNDYKSNMGSGDDPTDGQSKQRNTECFLSQFSEGGPRAETLNRQFHEGPMGKKD